MPRYTVHLAMQVCATIEVEAEDYYDAMELATEDHPGWPGELGINAFVGCNDTIDGGDWDTYEVRAESGELAWSVESERAK